MSSETITRTDLKNILNEVLPPIGSAILYNGTKVSSGTITLADDYTKYDFLLVSYKVNVDTFAELYDCAKIASAPTDKYQGAISIVDSGTTYTSTCKFSATDSTHLSVTNSGNNVNFVAGIVKIVGITSHDAKSGIAMDYIVEQGTDGIWTYRKWNSGISECWGTHTATLTHYATVFGGTGYCYYTGDVGFPTVLFNTTPNVQYSANIGGGISLTGSILTNTTKDKCVCYATTNQTGSQATIWNISAKGTWK